MSCVISVAINDPHTKNPVLQAPNFAKQQLLTAYVRATFIQ